jgi:pyruvate dehydrogenase complex dehydrogenase (E1) component
MPNEEYQELVRLAGDESRQRLIDGAPKSLRDPLCICLAPVSDAELPTLLGDLGGHDLHELLVAFDAADL